MWFLESVLTETIELVSRDVDVIVKETGLFSLCELERDYLSKGFT